MNKRQFDIVAHRGAMDEAPENTSAAFEAALAYAIDGIELDVQMTADDVLVICHDPDLKRITGDARAVADCTWDELSTMDWGGWFGEGFRGEPLLTLSACLERFAGRTQLMIEVKSFPRDAGGRNQAVAQAVVDLLAAGHTPEERVRILSFDPDVLETAGASGRWRCVRNLDNPGGISSIVEAPPYIDAYCASIHKIDPGTVDACHALGRRFMTWSCNTPEALRKAVACGCDVIMTDRPGWLVTQVDAHNNDT